MSTNRVPWRVGWRIGERGVQCLKKEHMGKLERFAREVGQGERGLAACTYSLVMIASGTLS